MTENLEERCPYVLECSGRACPHEWGKPYICEDPRKYEECEKYHVFKKELGK